MTHGEIIQDLGPDDVLRRRTTVWLRGLETADVFGVSQVGRNRLDFVAGDGLHPSGAQYAAWVEVIAPVAERVLSAPSGAA